MWVNCCSHDKNLPAEVTQLHTKSNHTALWSNELYRCPKVGKETRWFFFLSLHLKKKKKERSSCVGWKIAIVLYWAQICIAFLGLSLEDCLSCQRLFRLFSLRFLFLRCALEAKMTHIGVRYFQLCQNALLESILLADKNSMHVSSEQQGTNISQTLLKVLFFSTSFFF